MVDFSVSFSIEYKVGSGQLTQKLMREYIANRIATSIVLDMLRVSVVKINGQEFNLEEIRKRDRRF